METTTAPVTGAILSTQSKRRWTMNLEHTEKLRQIVLGLNNATSDMDEKLFLAVDYAFRVGKYVESGKDSDRNLWIGKHKKPAVRDLVVVFREKHTPDWDQMHLTHWTEWFMFQYVPSYYPGLEQQLAFFTRVLGGQHPLDAIQ